jgi:hypothetical protein
MTTLAIRKGHRVGATGNQNRQRNANVILFGTSILQLLIIQTRKNITMISRADAHEAAIHLIDALGPEAANAAHERTSEMLMLGDAGRYEVWSMILAVEDILDQKPQVMGRLH